MTDNLCTHCHRRVPPHLPAQNRYCDDSCRLAARLERRAQQRQRDRRLRMERLTPCAHCGILFPGTTKPGRPKKYHDGRCRRQAQRASGRPTEATPALHRSIPDQYAAALNDLLTQILTDPRLHRPQRLSRAHGVPMRIVTIALRQEPRVEWCGRNVVRRRNPEPSP